MRRANFWAGGLSAALIAMSAFLPHASAADKVIAGTLGGQAPLWPFYIALQKGFLAGEGIDMELNFAPSGSAIIQQLTGGSLDVVVSVGLPEPMQAIDKGAPLALIRIIGKSAPYALIAKPAIKSIAELRGKTISIGAPNDIIGVYFERMMAANGLKTGDYETVSAGVAAARFAALQAGVADAAMVLPPLNFRAAKSGYNTIGLAVDYVKNFPFTGMVVLKPWAAAHKEVVTRLLAATDQSIAWFEDPSHRAEAIDVLVKVGKATPDDADASYDYLRRIGYFESSDKISRAALMNVIAAETARRLVEPGLTVDRLVLTGVTKITD